MDKEAITLNGLEKLKEELIYLKEKKRPDHDTYVKNLKIKEKADRQEIKQMTKEMEEIDKVILPKKKPVNWSTPK